MQERILAAVDLGTTTTSLSVSRIDETGFTQVLWYGKKPSEGILRGNIVNPKNACKPLRALIEDAQEAVGEKIGSVVLALPRWKMKADSVEFSTQRTNPDDFISEDEIATLKDAARDSFKNLQEGWTIYGVIAQTYSTDDQFQVSESDVVGMTSNTLTGKYLVFSGPARAISNADKMAAELGVVIVEECLIPQVEAECVLSEDEREHGVALVEIGGGVTSVSIFHRGIMRSYGSFPFGGKSVTEDIRQECGIQERLAENIKLGFGSCMPDRLLSLSEKIIQISDKRTGDIHQLPVKYLSEIIGSRMHEIAEAVMHLIGESGYADKLKSGVVLTGGGADILSCGALFADISGYPVRVSYPHANNVDTAAATEITLLDAAAQLSMVNSYRSKAHISCATELPKAEEPKKEEKPKIEEPVATEGQGDLFGAEEPKPKEEPKKTKKPEKSEKPKKPGLFDKLNGFVGSLYEDLDSNENNG